MCGRVGNGIEYVTNNLEVDKCVLLVIQAPNKAPVLTVNTRASTVREILKVHELGSIKFLSFDLVYSAVNLTGTRQEPGGRGCGSNHFGFG